MTNSLVHLRNSGGAKGCGRAAGWDRYCFHRDGLMTREGSRDRVPFVWIPSCSEKKQNNNIHHINEGAAGTNEFEPKANGERYFVIPLFVRLDTKGGRGRDRLETFVSLPLFILFISQLSSSSVPPPPPTRRCGRPAFGVCFPPPGHDWFVVIQGQPKT